MYTHIRVCAPAYTPTYTLATSAINCNSPYDVVLQFIVLSLSCQRQDKNTFFCTQAMYTPEVSMPASAVRRKLLALPPALIMCLKVPSSLSFSWEELRLLEKKNFFLFVGAEIFGSILGI